jgi:lipid-binding SYLF domain-containing protein
MKRFALYLLAFLALSLPAAAQSPAERRAEIDKRSNEVLQRLYKAKPGAKEAISKAYGYAVFTNLGINLVFVSAAGGNGLARAKGAKPIYMKMASAGIGLGLGVKDFRGIFVFDNAQAFDKFVNSGWEAGAHADAVAKAGKEGGALEGAVTVAPGVRLYQLTENGLALEATIQGTKYFKDDELNK